MRILTFTSLYPNAAQPEFGVFVENRLRHLIGGGEVEARVLAPIPWFPGCYKDKGKAPLQERRWGIEIFHPRYLNIPGIGMRAQPALMLGPALKAARRLIAEGHDFDLIDAHYLYPDGVAAAGLAKAFGKPFTVTARGTDVSRIAGLPGYRTRILGMLREASGVIAVSAALRTRLVELGADGEKIVTLRNGVDLDFFHPVNREEARRRWNVSGKTILSIGHLIERKGHHLIVKALERLPDVTLLIAGSGEMQKQLVAMAGAAGLEGRVRFLGQLPQDALPSLYAAVDALVLASSREGWANVLLEAMACGTPVVATNVWGAPECVTAPEAGVLCARTPESIAAAIAALLSRPPEREATRRHAEAFGWEETTRGQLRLFGRILKDKNVRREERQ